jgi:toxin ParE1/3/4
VKPYFYHPEADIEVQDIEDYYFLRSIDAYQMFLNEFLPAIEKIQLHPKRYPSYLHHTQRFVLQQFPYSIIYREQLDAIQIIAVAHAKRRPGYWSKRT